VIFNIQQEKHKLLQGCQRIEGTGRLSSRYPQVFCKNRPKLPWTHSQPQFYSI